MIYFIQIPEGGPIKIGFTSTSARERLRNLSVASPFPLRLIGTMPGDQQTEKNLHKQFAEYKLNSEWFESHPSLINYIILNTDTKSVLRYLELSVADHISGNSIIDLDEFLNNTERELVQWAINKTNNLVDAAILLKINYRSLRYRMGKHKDFITIKSFNSSVPS